MNAIQQLKTNILKDIHEYINRQIAQIKINYLIYKKLIIEYLPDDKITIKLTALENIDKNEYEKLIKEVLNHKIKIYGKEIDVARYDFNNLNLITYLDIPF
ncbi:hypothetical protein [Caminibacter sp.]